MAASGVYTIQNEGSLHFKVITNMVKNAAFYFALQKEKLLLSKRLSQLTKEEARQQCELYRTKQEHIAFWSRVVSSSGQAFPNDHQSPKQDSTGRPARSTRKRADGKYPGADLSDDRRCCSLPNIDQHPSYLQRHKQGEYGFKGRQRRASCGVYPYGHAVGLGKNKGPLEYGVTTQSTSHGYTLDKIRNTKTDRLPIKQNTITASQDLENYGASGSSSTVIDKTPMPFDITVDKGIVAEDDLVEATSACTLNEKRIIGRRLTRTKYLLRKTIRDSINASVAHVKLRNLAGCDKEGLKQTPSLGEDSEAKPDDALHQFWNTERQSSPPDYNLFPTALSRRKKRKPKSEKIFSTSSGCKNQQVEPVDGHNIAKKLFHWSLSLDDSAIRTSTLINKPFLSCQHRKSQPNILPTWLEEDADVTLGEDLDTDPELQLDTEIVFQDTARSSSPDNAEQSGSLFEMATRSPCRLPSIFTESIWDERGDQSVPIE